MNRFRIGYCALVVLGACATKNEAIDLVERLSDTEARAGQITDAAALFSGISAEGRIGDWKIYNNRVQFIVQGDRPGDYYVDYPGVVVDADVVRDAEEVGQEFIDEWTSVVGLGRLLKPDTITVLSDGLDGGAAVLEVRGKEAPFELITGAAESPELIPNLGMEMVTTYTLRPDSQFLEVNTRVTSPSQEVTITVGDVLLASTDVSSLWEPTVGFNAPNDGPRRFTAYTANDTDGALAIVAASNQQLGTGPLSLLAELTDLAAMTSDSLTLGQGQSTEYLRYYAVGRDIGEITDELLELDGVATERFEQVIMSDEGPVAGARVTILLDGVPWTQTLSNASGKISVNVPTDSTVSMAVDGRGQGVVRDLPSGAGYFSPYADPALKQKVLESMASGSALRGLAKGYGTSSGEPLTPPGVLSIRSEDDLPFELRLTPLDAVPSLDRALYPARYSGEGIITWARDGTLEVQIEPGRYELVAHRGIRFEREIKEVTVTSGERNEINVALPQAYAHEGYLLGDPHSHSAPSNDASIPMADRLMVASGVGIQLHFGTDHDHVADYKPIVSALGLSPVLHSVVADEVSPPARGHLNLYPLTQSELANGGAWLWWANPVSTTEEQMQQIADHSPDDYRTQLNHPLSGGLGSSAGWEPGVINKGTYWSERFELIEVLNAGRYEKYLPFYYDLVGRGFMVAPTGVSDSHSHTGGAVGLSATFWGVGTDDVQACSDDVLRAAIDARNTIVTRGPYLDMSVAPGTMLTSASEVQVTAKSPSWMQVDRLILVRNGVAAETVDGTTATFALDAAEDSYYVVIAEGDTPMGGPWGTQTPWAMSAPIWVDVAGDGWTPPLAPLEVK